jgi:hypothetical protein
MPSSTIGTNQHYVPQMLLRGFLSDLASEQLQAFDKASGRTFPTTIRNVAAERDFYTVFCSDAIDAAMNRADDAAAPTIRKIRDTNSLRGLSLFELGALAAFTAIQMIRTRAVLEQWRDLGIKLINRLGEMTPEFKKEMQPLADAEKQREAFLKAIPGQTGMLMRHLLMKDLLLFQSDPTLPFVTSDNPVVKQNTLNPGDGVRGTLGLAIRGIEVYLPISSRLTVGFMCPSIAELHRELASRVERLGFISLRAHQYLHGLRTGAPVLLGYEATRFQNSLQVLNAERFVFAERDVFDDAREMVQDPESASGPRIVVN